MMTYQDLEKSNNNLQAFVPDAVQDFINSADYQSAKAGEAYYSKHNVTLEKYVKTLYTLSGAEVPDIFGADYKLKSLFFRRFVVQLTQYVLGNGVKIDHKDKLGKSFDYQMQKACKHALAAGRAFVFWNLDHIEVMSYVNTKTEPGFCPLYDENTGELKAGIRFWSRKIGDDTVWFYTLYTAEGYTDYTAKEGGKAEQIGEPKAYKVTTTRTEADGVLQEVGSDYGTLPIIPLYGNDLHESELQGIREHIDAYDFIKSGFANEIDDSSGFYWLLKNSGGMDDPDIARLWQRLKTVHGAAVPDDADIQLQTVNIPTEARKTMLELLRADLYEDAQILDVKSLSAAQKTTQEIQAAYQSQDNKAADLEYEILQCLDKLLPLAGIQEEATFTWQKVTNMTDQTNMILSAAPYLSDDCILEHLPFLTPEEIEAEKGRLEETQRERYMLAQANSNNDTDEPADTEEEETDA